MVHSREISQASQNAMEPIISLSLSSLGKERDSAEVRQYRLRTMRLSSGKVVVARKQLS
jgi:hypothetical protein